MGWEVGRQTGRQKAEVRTEVRSPLEVMLPHEDVVSGMAALRVADGQK